jgi:SAM-dependent methyltransferase
MQEAEYDSLAAQEDTLWWFSTLRRNLMVFVEHAKLPPTPVTVLDVGCGTGGFIRFLQRLRPGWRLVGLDLSEKAIDYARTRSPGATFVLANANFLPLAPESVDMVVSIDVLYHRAVQPKPFLNGIRSVLRKGGLVILNNPAYDWLLSYHDTHVDTARRYTVSSISRELQEAGFTIEFASYWNTVLFPLMVLKRKVLKGSSSQSDVHPIPHLLNTTFDFMTRFERALLERKVKLPYGGSVLIMGRKENG